MKEILTLADLIHEVIQRPSYHYMIPILGDLHKVEERLINDYHEIIDVEKEYGEDEYALSKAAA